MILSIALNMGLHRDGALFNLDPFVAEMRRRVWAALVVLDGYRPQHLSNCRLNSASYGRPMMISDSQYDTKPHSCINDIDFNPGKPVPKSETEVLTDCTYSACN